MDNLLTLCMIVKDEEDVLERCLSSVQGLVDEIIIVDTGSTDSTKEIALKYTEHVLDKQWSHDFSAARNESIGRATSKWVLILDADEYVEQQDINKLREFLSTKNQRKPIGFILPIINYHGESKFESRITESSAARLFANGHGIHYKNPIHEQLSIHDGMIHFENFPFRIHHSGYMKEVHQRKNKSQRNMKIFEDIQKSGKKLTPYDFFTLANEYAAIDDYKKALYYYERSLDRSKPTDSWYSHSLNRMINTLLLMDRLGEAYELVEKSLSQWKHLSDYHFMKGIIFDHVGRYEEAIEAFTRSIQIADEMGKNNQAFWLISPDYGQLLPYQRLADIYTRWRDTPKTVFYLTKILNVNAQNLNALMKLASILAQTEETKSIIAFFSQLYPKHITVNRLLLFNVFLTIGHEELASHYLRECEEAQAAIGSQDWLTVALLQKDQHLFNSTFEKLSGDPDEAVIKKTIIASFLWGGEYLTRLNIDSENRYDALIEFFRSFADQTHQPATLEEQWHDTIYSILTDLYSFKMFDAYDRLVQAVSSPMLINQMAHYFYAHHQMELAMEYYSLLLNANEMDSLGYENLGFLYLSQQFNDEGLQFMEAAIELSPKKPHLYSVLSSYCSDKNIKQSYKYKFEEQFPNYKKLFPLHS